MSLRYVNIIILLLLRKHSHSALVYTTNFESITTGKIAFIYCIVLIFII